MKQMYSIIGALLIVLGVGFFIYHAVALYSMYRMMSLIGGRIEAPTLEAWAYWLGGVIVIFVGILLVFRAKRIK